MPASGPSGWAAGVVAIVLGAWITTTASAASLSSHPVVADIPLPAQLTRIPTGATTGR
jgi:hypothetical protein